MEGGKRCGTCSELLTKKQLAKRPNAKYCSKECGGKRKRSYPYRIDFLDIPNDFCGYFIGLFITDGHKTKMIAL